MKWFKNLTVTIQIIVLIMLTAAFIAMISCTGFYFNQKATNALNEVYNNEILPITMVGNFRTKIRAEQADVLTVMFGKKPLNENQKQRTEMVLKDFETYEQSVLLPEEKEKISNLKEQWKAHVKLKEKILALALSGKTQEAFSMYSTQMQPIIANMGGELANIEKKHLAAAKLADEENERNAMISNRMIIGIALLSLFVSIFVGLRIARMIGLPIQRVTAALAEVADGKIHIADLPVESKNEIGRLSGALNKMKNDLGAIVQQIGTHAEQVAASSEELTASAEESSKAAALVAETIEEVAGGAEQQLKAASTAQAVVGNMSTGLTEVAGVVCKITEMAEQTTGVTKDGVKAIDEVTKQMQHIAAGSALVQQSIDQLSDGSKEIGEFVGVIGNLASQTNLLALNAAIEAARAGEQGKGFAVVAEEVRKLAEQSQSAAQKISVLIHENEVNMDNAVASMGEGAAAVNVGTAVVANTGETFLKIDTAIKAMTGQVERIAALTSQMSANSTQVVGAVQSMDAFSKQLAGQTQTVSAATEEQSASMQEIAASSEVLAKMAEQLRQILQKFSL
ncbi:methyl-accepting chemotaxis protein [Anaerosinus massiliensis]|uniref:methyl-accepting chemotaxis protein n=1 Tax=Massilibacillus massiliensis TaxID=1806837 RepID=UPI000AFA3FC6|nr:methyl-accepting chemotaxis protein [Massilibacillus massiliensis]